MDLSSRPLEMMLIKNLKREEALMSGGCVALAHKQHLTKTRSYGRLPISSLIFSTASRYV
jgi:hypothetical protein